MTQAAHVVQFVSVDTNTYDLHVKNRALIITTTRGEDERRKRQHQWDKDVVFEVHTTDRWGFSTTEYLTQQGEQVYDPTRTKIVTKGNVTVITTDHGASTTVDLRIRLPPLNVNTHATDEAGMTDMTNATNNATNNNGNNNGNNDGN